MKKFTHAFVLAALSAAPVSVFAAPAPAMNPAPVTSSTPTVGDSRIELSETFAVPELVITENGKFKGNLKPEENTVLRQDKDKKAFNLPLSKPSRTWVRFFAPNRATGMDLSGTNTLNFWLNNPKRVGQKMILVLNLAHPDGSVQGAGRRLEVPLDFEGWKEFTIPYDTMTPFPSSSGDLSKARAVDFTINNPDDKSGDEVLVITRVTAFKK